MNRQTRVGILAILVLSISALMLQGCGGGGGGISTVSGTVADINRNTITDATVTVDDFQTKSLASGTFRINGVESGWKTFRATAIIDGDLWVGSTAVEVLKDTPTMNAHIVLAPSGETTDIGGIVRDDTGRRRSGARVLLTTRTLYPGQDTSAYDGPYGSIVAITDSEGHYVLEDVPAGINVTVAASLVGFRNDEVELTTTQAGMVENFDLVASDLSGSPTAPYLDAIESYTMPDNLVRSGDGSAYKAIKAYTSKNYRKSLIGKKTTLTRATPLGSLIEVDLYWNALDQNDSRDVAGYGIYRTTNVDLDPKAIDFIRDPYANFFADTEAVLTPYTNYFYAVTTVDVQFLDSQNQPDDAAESNTSNFLAVTPLDQLRLNSPSQGADLSGNPTFVWTPVQGAQSYTIYLYSEYPTLPLDPSYDYTGDPAGNVGALPVWPRTSSPDETTVGAGANSLTYNGPALVSGHTYYWVVLATKVYEEFSDGSPMRAAYSYSQIRSFTR